MRVSSLGSGSKGNATLIQVADTTILVDCGFGLKEIEGRLRSRGVEPDSLAGILVTHEHADHLKGAPMLANRYGIPLCSTHGTARYFKRPVATARPFHPSKRIAIGSLDIEPVTVPHDSAEPSQFVFHHQGLRFGLLTDLGSLTKHIHQAYQDCQVLMLECNHDPDMLHNGPYPPSLKRRVGGDFGHLSNAQAAQLLKGLNHSALQRVLVSHISEHNNDPALAIATLLPELDGHDTKIEMLTQQDGCDWITLQPTA